jgi:chaperonin cofactor prefoldin
MALNQIPYTNVHELNLDWILKKLQEFEARLEAIENYDDEIEALRTAVHNLETSLSSLKTTVNSSLTALNARCTALENKDDEIMKRLSDLWTRVNSELTSVRNEFAAFQAALTALRAYNDSSNQLVLHESKEYTDRKITALLDYFEDPGLVYVVNPWTREVQTLQEFIDTLPDMFNVAGFTCSEFDALGLTCSTFDGLGLTCLEFDQLGKFALFLHGSYVTPDDLTAYAKLTDLEPYATKTELEHYATLNDIKVINPCTGLLGSAQDAFISLASLHQNNVTADQFDSMNLTCSIFDSLNITAFEFDFYGLIKFIDGGYISQLSGITATQYQNIMIGAGGQLFTTL